MTKNELENRLEAALKSALRAAGHVESGKLNKSIKFNVTETPNGIKIEFSGLEYIQYLDNGRFLDDFLNSSQVFNLQQDYILAYIDIQVTDSLHD